MANEAPAALSHGFSLNISGRTYSNKQKQIIPIPAIGYLSAVIPARKNIANVPTERIRIMRPL
jgi:hypothetical protein